MEVLCVRLKFQVRGNDFAMSRAQWLCVCEIDIGEGNNCGRLKLGSGIKSPIQIIYLPPQTSYAARNCLIRLDTPESLPDSGLGC